MNIAFIVTLLIIGLVLLMLEIFVIPGVGVAGILGVAALIAGCYLSFNFGTTVGLIVTGCVLVILIILICIALREKTWTRLALNTKVDSSAGQDSGIVSVDDCGETVTRLAPMGTARINGVAVEVKSFEGFLDRGTKVKVVMIEDNIIYVKPVEVDF